MSLTLQDVYGQSDYLIMHQAGFRITFQDYDREGESNELDLEYDSGGTFKVLPLDTPVESFSDGTILIDGVLFRAYVAQQVKFEPTKD